MALGAGSDSDTRALVEYGEGRLFPQREEDLLLDVRRLTRRRSPARRSSRSRTAVTFGGRAFLEEIAETLRPLVHLEAVIPAPQCVGAVFASARGRGKRQRFHRVLACPRLWGLDVALAVRGGADRPRSIEWPVGLPDPAVWAAARIQEVFAEDIEGEGETAPDAQTDGLPAAPEPNEDAERKLALFHDGLSTRPVVLKTLAQSADTEAEGRGAHAGAGLTKDWSIAAAHGSIRLVSHGAGLLPKREAAECSARDRRGALVHAAAAALCMVAAAWVHLDTTRRSLAAGRFERQALAPIVAGMAEARSAIEEATDRLEAIQWETSSRPGYLATLEAVASALPEDAYLRAIAFAKDTIELATQAASAAKVEAAFEASPPLTGARVVGAVERTEGADPHPERFTLRLPTQSAAQIRPRGGQ
jgi:Tfp pilus assembly protein PilN